jgi:Short C-terminal domain
MRRLRDVRRSGTDLLTRPPALASSGPPTWLSAIIDPVEQLAELAKLRDRGFISADDLERQKAKVLGR